MQHIIRRRFIIAGQVQGVGFRPFVFRIAHERQLTGTVCNAPEGVVLEVQGPPEATDGFGRDLTDKLPPLARITSLEQSDVETVDGEEIFAILASSAGQGHNVLISPDTATCDDCLADMRDPANPRYRYPFTNCTNCGPRYTITRSIPYDREKTSMACFPLCPVCREEYENPLDRRFHAQPNACPECGPKVWLCAPSDEQTALDNEQTAPDTQRLVENDAAILRIAELLAQGRIAAIKGLGGFHLAVDACNGQAVERLRERKNRKGKPLAVMVPDLETARQFAHISPAEEKWLTGNKRPIMLLRKKSGTPLAQGISPDNEFFGVMLPYTPLHHVLFEHYRARTQGPPALVMTSGNSSSAPIAIGNREALQRLGGIADVFLLHNRDILIRTDDSVMRILPAAETEDGTPQMFRRARGFTPSPVFLAQKGACVFGTGPELKNTMCYSKGDQAFVSQHIGDMENLETYGFYKEIAAHLQDILQVTPELLVHDLHPDYMTTPYAAQRSREENIPMVGLQHHYAHIHSVAAENKHQGPLIGLALDGTGYGEDATLWGGECLYVDTRTLEHRRLAHFTPVPLPGGEAAIRNPWRIAQAMLRACGMELPPDKTPWLPAQTQAANMVEQMLERGVNCPLSSSCGRLFDAVAALLGICLEVSYEGQAAIRLEAAQDMNAQGRYECTFTSSDGAPVLFDTLHLFAQAARDHMDGVAPGVISRKFHAGLVFGLAELAASMAEQTGTKVVGLSGGVMQNKTLSLELPAALKQRGLTALTHTELPPNDGCISLGQVAYGMRLLALQAEAG
ncbi:MAG: carbamoyltransferase HypF [Desulfovibrio sp.]|uniref:carbamoyltransferase HypF n=1 Tax=Desulfovibrio sp. 7SRBS1 TaxID=3378064 RepID=UPI003B41FB6D